MADKRFLPLGKTTLLTLSTSLWLLAALPAEAGNTNGDPPGSSSSAVHLSPVRNTAIAEWFARFDQIRRAAELTGGERWQMSMLSDKEPNQRSVALASRTLNKYRIALGEMLKLGSIPETIDLQEGYIEYFSTAVSMMEKYLEAAKIAPYSNRALLPIRRRLQGVQGSISKLDDTLRKEYGIEPHKHI